MKKLVGMLTGLFLLVGMAGTPANAATFTSDHCDPACGPQPNGFATITGPAGQEGNWFVQETRQVGDTTTVDASVLYESGNCVVQWQATSA